MIIRSYRPTDAQATLDVFRHAVHVTARADYSPAQLEAWAPEDLDVQAWGVARASAQTLVAEVDGQLAGFIDCDDSGYIDMLFVHPDWSRRGVATALLAEAVNRATQRHLDALTVHASLTARPFFEANGFTVTREQHPVVRGVALTNFAMRRELGS